MPDNPAAVVVRRVRIENVYEDDIVVNIREVELFTRDAFDSDDDYEAYLDETLFELTGTGRTEGNAMYEVTSVDGLEPVIDMGWGG